MVRVAVAQFAPGVDATANLDAVRRFVGVAAAQGAALVVLPEYASYFQPRMGPDFAAHAEPLDGPFVRAVVDTAREHDVTVVFGLVETGEGDRFRNTAVAVTGGGVVASYRKTHLYDAFGAKESTWVEPGPLEAPQTFDVGDLTIGLQTCYDLRFPEVTRTLVDAGVDVVVVPADWVPGERKVDQWRTLVTARAIESTAYVAAAGQIPPAGVGTSLVIGPAGEVLAELAEAEGVAVAELDARRLDEVRRINPAVALRRYRVVPR